MVRALPSRTLSEYRLCISFDEGLEFLILIGGGSYSVNQDFAETIMSINGQNQPGQAQATAESFKGDIRLTRFSPNTLLWRYTTSDNQYGSPVWMVLESYVLPIKLPCAAGLGTAATGSAV